MKRAIAEINYKSDFDFILHLEGESGFPEFNFTGEIWPERIRELKEAYGCDWGRLIDMQGKTGIRPYIFYKRGKELHNCFDDDGKIHVVADNHGLPPGRLLLILKSYLPNAMYPDGTKKIERIYPLYIELVEGSGDCDVRNIDIELTVPYVYITAYHLARSKGYTGTEEEFLQALADVGEMGSMAEETRKTLQEWQQEKDNFIRNDITEEELREELQDLFTED